jgi:hypothetical protein
MKLTLSSGLYGDAAVRHAYPASGEVLYVPPTYVGEKPRPFGGAVEVPERFACRLHGTIDATVEWNASRQRFVATSATCEHCASEAAEAPAPRPREFRAKITGWRGTHGFAVPLRGEADDVSEVYVGGAALCRHIGEQESYRVTSVPIGTIATLFDVTPPLGGNGRHNVRFVECEACVMQRYERERSEKAFAEKERRAAAAEKRVAALFEKGHRFDTGRKVPSFYRTGIARSPHLAAFHCEALRAALDGADDATIKQRAEAAARADLDAAK